MDDEPPTPYDWEREPDWEWIDRFGRAVAICFLVGLTILVVAVLVGCSSKKPTILIPIEDYTTTTTLTP